MPAKEHLEMIKAETDALRKELKNRYDQRNAEVSRREDFIYRYMERTRTLESDRTRLLVAGEELMDFQLDLPENPSEEYMRAWVRTVVKAKDVLRGSSSIPPEPAPEVVLINSRAPAAG